MFGHCALLLATIDASGLRIGNLLGELPAIAPITWIVQVMPLFFLAGGAAGAYGWHQSSPWGTWLFNRAQRLCRPVFWYLAAWSVGLAVTYQLLGADSAASIGRECVALLWFLGVYLVVLAFVPALTRMSTGRAVAVAVVALIAASAGFDAIRFAVGTPMAGVANFVIVWLIPMVIGVAYARQLIGPRAALVVAASAFVAQVVLAAVGPYEVSLVVTGNGADLERVPADAVARAALHLDVLSVCGRRGSDPPVGAAAPRLVPRRDGQRGSDDALPLAHPRDRGRHLHPARHRTRRVPR